MLSWCLKNEPCVVRCRTHMDALSASANAILVWRSGGSEGGGFVFRGSRPAFERNGVWNSPKCTDHRIRELPQTTHHLFGRPVRIFILIRTGPEKLTHFSYILSFLIPFLCSCETDGDILSLSTQLCKSVSEVHTNAGFHHLHIWVRTTSPLTYFASAGFWINLNVPMPSLFMVEQLVRS